MRDGNTAVLLRAEMCGFEDTHCIACFVEVADVADEGCDGSMELPQHLLADRKLGIEGFLMSTGIVKPDQGGR